MRAILVMLFDGGEIAKYGCGDYNFVIPFNCRLVSQNLRDIYIGPAGLLKQNFYIEQTLIFASNLHCGDTSVRTEFEVGDIADSYLTHES
ncbi:MAG: hypothetical protein N2746_03615 [Deltaproteobacteria bacterium]|nr:hypothetical protein [Deltaproteobacteria bacterium]